MSAAVIVRRNVAVVKLTPGHALPEEFELVPDLPGLYAWYPRFDPPAGLLASSDRDRFRALLDLYDAPLATPPSLRLTARMSNNFGSSWKSTGLQAANKPMPKSVEGVVEQADLRQALWEGLSTARAVVPFISAPLYVGETTGLRGRLLEHLKQLEQFGKDPESIDETDFAGRAARLDLVPDLLQVWYVSFEYSMSHSVIVAIQDLLNRWHRPVLGRK